MSVEDFHERLEANPSTLLETLSETKGMGHWAGGPTWDDSLALVTAAVQADPGDGSRLLGVDPRDQEVTAAVIRGWSRAELEPEAAAEIIGSLNTLDLTALARDLASMLSDGATTEGHPTDWTAVPGARRLARDLWLLISDEAVEYDETDWLFRAINHPSGELAEFWLHVVQNDWRADEEAWSGLAGEHRDALEAMLGGPAAESRTQIAEVICASRLHFLFAADPDWTVAHVLPIFSWTDPSRARRAWSSFTSWGRWNDRMLDAGLMERYLEAALHVAEFDDDQRGSILGHLAGIALTSDRDPLAWLPGVIAGLRDEDRATFAEKVGEILDDLPDEAVQHQWSRWMQNYWTDRLSSVPVQLSGDEPTAMAGWIPFLSESFESGVQLVTQRPGRFREHSDVLRHLERHVDTSPDACSAMIGHLMRGTEPPWWGGHQLPTLMPRLRAGSDPENIRVIIEQAIRLGMSNPEAW